SISVLSPPAPDPLPLTYTPSPNMYSLSLHDALPISAARRPGVRPRAGGGAGPRPASVQAGRRDVPPGLARPQGSRAGAIGRALRSEEHTSELHSRENLVCRLLLEKKKTDALRCCLGI